MSLYDDLGVPADATPEQIAKAHRDGVKKHHPDRKGGDRDKFELVQRAAVVLRDPDKRAHYDRTGETETGANNAMAELTAVLMRAFDQAMQATDWKFGDVAGQMRGQLRKMAAQIRARQKDADETAAMVSEALDRLGFNGEGYNPIARVLSERRDGIVASRAAMARELASVETAIDFAGGYSWRFDQKSPQSPDPWLTLQPRFVPSFDLGRRD